LTSQSYVLLHDRGFHVGQLICLFLHKVLGSLIPWELGGIVSVVDTSIGILLSVWVVCHFLVDLVLGRSFGSIDLNVLRQSDLEGITVRSLLIFGLVLTGVLRPRSIW
jgi:hypothetical protein